MSDTLIDIKAALTYGSPESRLAIIKTIMKGFAANMNGDFIILSYSVAELMTDLDPNLASKQDQAFKDQATRYQ